MISDQVMKDHFEKVVQIVHEKSLLDEDIKLIKQSLKDEGVETEDIKAFIQAATAKAKEKTEEVVNGASKVTEMIERFA